MFIMNMFPSDKINFLGFCAEETSENSTQIYYCYMTTDSRFGHCTYLWWTSRFSFQVLYISIDSDGRICPLVIFVSKLFIYVDYFVNISPKFLEIKTEVMDNTII